MKKKLWKKSFFIFNKNQIYSPRCDYFSYMHYRYHRLLFHSLIFKGKKLKAFNFLLRVKYNIKQLERVEPFWVLLFAFLRITPLLTLFPYKMGRQIHKVPFPITERKQYTFAIKFVTKVLKSKYRIISVKQLVDVLISSIYNRGAVIAYKRKLYIGSLQNQYMYKYFK